MPALDKPLQELENYLGSSPCPADIDAFWDKSLKLIDDIDPKVELKPSATFNVTFAECYDLTFTSIDNSRIYAKYLKPKAPNHPHPAVLEFHGYSGNSGDWNSKLNYVAAGFSIAAMDCRGQGGQSQDGSTVHGNTFKGHIIRGLDDGPENLLFRRNFLDTV